MSRQKSTERSFDFQMKLRAIMVQFIKDHHYPPSVRDLQQMTGVKSTSTIHGYMEKMHENGLIEIEDPGRGRCRAYRINGIEIVDQFYEEEEE